MNPLDIIKENDSLKQLGGAIPSNDLMNGGMEVLFGLISGTAGKGASTSTPLNLASKQREQEFMQHVSNSANNADNRLPSIIEKTGKALGGEGAGEEWKQAFSDLPDMLKNIIQTAFNQSMLGSLTGGDPRALASASVSMLRGNNEFTNPGGLGLGGQTSPQRKALAGQINSELIGHFQGQDGLPIMERTQGQSFENISKFAQSMSEQGGLNAKTLVDGIDEQTGQVNLDSSAMDSAKKNISQGMELFRNLTDVFGSSDFNELMRQAERLGGLNLQDPSSIRKSLAAVRNARGVAQSVGVDERTALGDLSLANDTMVAMGVDRRTAAAFNNQGFAGAMVQGMRNTQQTNPFDTGFRRQMGTKELMQGMAISNTAILAEAENRPMGEVSMAQQLRMFKAKPRQMSEALSTQIDNALNETDPGKRTDMLKSAIASVEDETGIDTIAMTKQIGLGKLRELQDADTLEDMAQDNRRILLTRNKERFKKNFMPMEFNVDLMRQKAGKDPELQQGLQDFEDLMVNSTDFGGLQNLSKMAGIAEGKDGDVEFFDEEKNRMVTMNAKDMDNDTKQEVITQQLEARGVEGPEAEKVAKTLMRMPKMLEGLRNKTGMSVNDMSAGFANMAETMGLTPEMTQFLIGDDAVAAGIEAGKKGSKALEGGPAMTDPLQNLLFGMMGDDSAAEIKGQAFDESGLAKQTVSVNALTTTETQRDLMRRLGDGDSIEDLSKTDTARRAMADMGSRIFKGLEGVELGDSNLLEKILETEGVKDPEKAIDSFKKDMAQAARLERSGTEEGKQQAAELRQKHFGTLQAVMEQLGGDGTSRAPMRVMGTLAEEGVATRTVAGSGEDMQKRIDEANGRIPQAVSEGLKKAAESTNLVDKTDGAVALSEELSKLDAEAAANVDLIAQKQEELAATEVKDMDDTPKEVEEARNFVRSFDDEGSGESFKERVNRRAGDGPDALTQYRKHRQILADYEEETTENDAAREKTNQLEADIRELQSPEREAAKKRNVLKGMERDIFKGTGGRPDGWEEMSRAEKDAWLKDKRASAEADADKAVQDIIKGSELATTDDTVAREDLDNLSAAMAASESGDDPDAFIRDQKDAIAGLESKDELTEEEKTNLAEKKSLVETAEKVFATDERDAVKTLEGQKASGGAMLELVVGGKEEIEQRMNFINSAEARDADKQEKLINALGTDDVTRAMTQEEKDTLTSEISGLEGDIAEAEGDDKVALEKTLEEKKAKLASGQTDIRKDIDEFQATGRTKKQLESEIADLEDGLGELDGADKEKQQATIAEKKEQLEGLPTIGSTADLVDGIFERDLMGTKGDKDKDLISTLASGSEEDFGNIVSAFEGAGVNKLEMRDQLQAAQEKLQSEPQSEERDARLDELKAAQEKLVEAMDNDETNTILVDMLDIFRRASSGNGLNVNLIK